MLSLASTIQESASTICLPRCIRAVSASEVLSEAEWQASLEESRKRARELVENPKVEPVISDVQSLEVLKLFLDVGDELNLAPKEVKRALIGLNIGGDLHVTVSEYRRK
jgi:hypothetical protein